MRGWLVGYLAVLVVVYLAVPPERARPDRVLLVSLLVFAMWRLRRSVGRVARPWPDWQPPAPDLGPPDELDTRLARLEAALRYATDSRGQYERSVRPMLADLVAERLRGRHGVDLASDPRRARTILGEELWHLVSAAADREAPGAGPPPAELDRLLSQVEAL